MVGEIFLSKAEYQNRFQGIRIYQSNIQPGNYYFISNINFFNFKIKTTLDNCDTSFKIKK